MQKIGLFGGSFDPVHLGHLLVAQAAREELRLDRIYFIPAAQSPFKASEQHAPGAERVRLLRLALAGRPEFEIDEQEIARGGISYSIDTVRDYARRFPQTQLFYLIGSDQLGQLPKWREAGELAQLVELVIVSRPGEPPDPIPRPFRARAIKGFPVHLSSSQIRERVRANQSIDLLVPPAVAEAIRNNRLYL